MFRRKAESVIGGVMHFRRGFRDWWGRRAQIANKTQIANEKWGIVRVVGVPLYLLTVASPTTLAYIVFGTKEHPLYWFTDVCVVGALILSVGIYYLAPNVCLAWLSTYFSATTVIVLLNVVLLEGVFGGRRLPSVRFCCSCATSRRSCSCSRSGIGGASSLNHYLHRSRHLRLLTTLKQCHALPWLKLRRTSCC